MLSDDMHALFYTKRRPLAVCERRCVIVILIRLIAVLTTVGRVCVRK